MANSMLKGMRAARAVCDEHPRPFSSRFCAPSRSTRLVCVCATKQRRRKKDPEEPSTFTVDNLNPIQLGREARRVFDDVWDQFTKLASPTRSFNLEEYFDDEVSDLARNTTVLVVGATGRVGRVVVRKLLLRGYKVKALVRRREAGLEQRLEGLPAKIEFLEGDVGDRDACQQAIVGVDKVIFCAAARSSLRADLGRVEDRGVMTVLQAFQDEYYRQASRAGLRNSRLSKKEVADFQRAYHQQRWDITFVGAPDSAGGGGGGQYGAAGSRAVAEITPDNNLVFEGVVSGRGALAEVGAQLEALPGGSHRTADTEGLLLRVMGDGNQYACVVRTAAGETFVARFPTRLGFSTVRLPWTVFRPERDTAATLDPADVVGMAIRYEQKRVSAGPNRQLLEAGLRLSPNRPLLDEGGSGREAAAAAAAPQPFRLEVDWIKALPTGREPDFILVSAANAGRSGVDGDTLYKLLQFKRKGEDNVRHSGIGYTIIRPGPLVQAPGGYKALVFDQGERLQQEVGIADVADICVRALHDPAAVNKTFEVGWEAESSADSQYELVAQVPDKSSNSYLGTVLSTLQKNI